ncbi:unnamed protein product [Clavelina lepadiformis]|uniref:UHRF1-binding protein 1-like n=1 Tax=Clavelina lepadiformis TaxID=159417 RepID=A0ABP0G651_CLALP
MASLIKKQILKHLSKFAKNLSADSIQLSTLRGEGELSNLELDCVAIQNLVDLPTWLQINHAKCNKVHVKIPWTKLKTTPITIFLDSVDLDMVACEKPRPPNGASPIQASASSGDSSYGFIQKVLEGIAVRINSINVNFSSAVFRAEFQLSQLLVYSTDPDGKKADLRFTRILNKAWGQVLTFKKVTWQTMRIVTDAAGSETTGLTTPIRLITNQATISIVLRRKVSDLSILASRLHIQFDDLLWVLSDAQVQSALLCVKSIRETIERSQQQGRTNETYKTQQNTQTISPPNTPQVMEVDPSTANDPYFMRHIIHESSVHGDIDRIDLHICDDGSNPNKEATYKKVVEGGAILITLHNLRMDHYPRHKAGKSRAHFRNYLDTEVARDKWAEEIIVTFRKDFVELKKAAKAAGFEGPQSSAKLQENCLLFRLGDVDVGQVSSASDKERTNQKVLSSLKKELLLPDDMPFASAIITDYYFPDGRDYPAPHNNIFIRINAPHLRAHWPSLLWMNQLALSTMKSVQGMLEDLGVVMGGGDPKEEEHIDIRIETLMPKIFIPASSVNEDPNSPEGIEIQVSQAAVTNCRYGENSSRESLSQILNGIKESFIKKNETSFPNDKGHDFDFMYRLLEDHACGGDMPIRRSLMEHKLQLSNSSLKKQAYQDVWSIWLRQIWLNFVMKDPKTGQLLPKSKSFAFVDSVPITMWLCKTETSFEPVRETGKNPPKATGSTQSTPAPTPKREKVQVPKSQSDDCIASSTMVQADHNISNTSTSSNRLTNGEVSLPSASEQNENGRPHRSKLLDFYRHALEETKPEPKLPRPVPIVEGAANTYIFLHSDKAARIMLNHHQFLFLLRLADSIQNIGEKVFSDTNTIFSDRSSIVSLDTLNDQPEIPEDSSSVRLLLPSVELYLVLRSAPTDEESTDDDKDSKGLLNHLDKTAQTAPIKENKCFTETSSFVTKTRSSSEPLRPLTPSSSDCSSLDTVSILGDEASSLNLFSPIPQSCPLNESPLGVTQDISSLPSSPTLGSRCNTSDPCNALRRKAESRIQSRMQEASNLSSSASCENVSRSGTVTSSGYETGSYDSISAIMTSQDEDTQSISSSGTSSLDQFVFLEIDSVNSSKSPNSLCLNEQPVQSHSATGKVNSSSNEDSELMTDSQMTVVDESRKSHEQKETSDETKMMTPQEKPSKVSVLCIKAENGLELCVDSHASGSSIRIVAQQVALNELGNLTIDAVGELFNNPADSPKKPKETHPPHLRMRIDSGHCASRFYPSGEGHIAIEADGVKLKVLSSTLANIGAFLEDEVEPEILPMRIAARNTNLTIQDDGKPVYPTTAKSPPVVLNVQEAFVRRDTSGVFHVETTSSTSSLQDLFAPLSSSTREEAAPQHEQDEITEVHAIPTFSGDTKSNHQPDPRGSDETQEPPDCNKEESIDGNLLNGFVSSTDDITVSHGPVHKPLCRLSYPPHDNGDVSPDVAALKKQLEEMTQERDSLVTALTQMQVRLVINDVRITLHHVTGRLFLG